MGDSLIKQKKEKALFLLDYHFFSTFARRKQICGKDATSVAYPNLQETTIFL